MNSNNLRFGSVCSGIEAASVAWHPLGWRAAWLAEIEPFPAAVLAHHFPTVPNLGDMTTIARRVLTGEVEAPDVFTGGTPCQAFSVAGLRESLADERGNLTLKFVELADAIDFVRGRAGKPASVVVWENVPGVLSTADNAFGCFLAGLAGEDEPLQPAGAKWTDAGCVYGPRRAVAWRTLDAQHFGLAQRRRRVFVVASARNDLDPAQVLFEWAGSRRDTPPSRGQGQEAAPGAGAGAAGRSLQGVTAPAIAFHPTQDPISNVDLCHALGTGSSGGTATAAVAFREVAQTITSNYGKQPDNSDTSLGPNLAAQGMKVRRLTPEECEALQGFPRGWTRIAWGGKPAEECPDGHRYKAIGNSWATLVARWIGRRIDAHLAGRDRLAA